MLPKAITPPDVEYGLMATAFTAPLGSAEGIEEVLPSPKPVQALAISITIATFNSRADLTPVPDQRGSR